MAYRKVSKNSWRYKIVQWVVKNLIGKVGNMDNIIYPYDDLVGHGVMVLLYFRDEEKTIHFMVGSREYGDFEKIGLLSGVIGYTNAAQSHEAAAEELLKDRMSLKGFDPRLLKLECTHLATMNNEYRDNHQTLTVGFSYELNEMPSSQSSSMYGIRSYTLEDLHNALSMNVWAQVHEADMIKKIVKKLESEN